MTDSSELKSMTDPNNMQLDDLEILPQEEIKSERIYSREQRARMYKGIDPEVNPWIQLFKIKSGSFPAPERWKKSVEDLGIDPLVSPWDQLDQLDLASMNLNPITRPESAALTRDDIDFDNNPWLQLVVLRDEKWDKDQPMEFFTLPGAGIYIDLCSW